MSVFKQIGGWRVHRRTAHEPRCSLDNGLSGRTSTCVETVNTALLADLANWRNNPEIAAGIAHACGARIVDDLMNPEIYPVYGYWLEPGQQVFMVWLLVADAFVLHERSLDGQALTLSVPRRRIRRVVEQNASRPLRVTVEIDADRVVVELGGTGDEEGNVALSGRAIHAGYTIVADLNDTIRAGALSELARSVHRFTQH
jgi:hypothetical protein